MDGASQGSPLTTVLFQSNLNMVTQLCAIYDSMFPMSESGDKVYDSEVIECGFVQVRIE